MWLNSYSDAHKLIALYSYTYKRLKFPLTKRFDAKLKNKHFGVQTPDECERIRSDAIRQLGFFSHSTPYKYYKNVKAMHFCISSHPYSV